MVLVKPKVLTELNLLLFICSVKKSVWFVTQK